MTIVYDENEDAPRPKRKFVPEEIDKVRLLPRLRERQRRL